MTMYTVTAAKRRLVNIDEVGRLETIARRWNAGQTVGHSAEQPTTNQHKA